jgi:K+-sensing histidine kinase KdpD
MMEEKKTVFNYISQAFATFGIIVLIFILFSLAIGESTEGYSNLFSMGKRGMSIPTLCELLLLAIMITLAQVVFLTDKWIVNLSLIIRNVLFFLSVLIVMVIMIVTFKWFPVGDVSAWIGFIISFAISMIVSALVVKLKERADNSKMQEALDNYNKGK